MTDATRQRRARLVLWAWAIASVLALAYVGLLFLSSMPVTSAVAEDLAYGRERPVTEGDRLLVVPVQDPRADVRGLAAEEAPRVLGARGDVVAYLASGEATARDLVPFRSGPREFARVLVHVDLNTTSNASAPAWDVPALNVTNVTALNLTDVPTWNASAETFERANATLDLTGFHAQSGFVVKRDGDALANATLISDGMVTGKVDRTVSAFALYGAFFFSAIGAALPLVLIVLTHRGRGGPRSARDANACGECSHPIDTALGFCPSCGARPPEPTS